ncbi:secretory protein [Virgibacillus phasianinus]|uniref:Secretory protein n=1 Tax=Virgibacillus phasianinus TaxID=2017483 RepID=A0A220TXI0_9BACI|nr:basic secretory protein-like protein [Virgibacillus phasianinus]ASK60704.1 secretory protein [Virgibacillus phasianinus]
MKRLVSGLICTGLLVSGFGGYSSVLAKETASYETSNFTQTTQEYEKRRYKLEVINGVEDPAIKPLIDEFVDLYFKVYPKLVRKYSFNPKEASRNVTLEFDPAYDGVAYADNGKIVVSSNWILTHPDDVALFTHELTHIAQGYPTYNDDTWWITEGIADYTRYVYGPHNGSWRLPEEIKETDNYDSGYRVTARFLLWITQHKNHFAVDIINREMQKDTFNLDIFEEITGKSIEDLWAEYRQNPEVRTHY